VSNINVTAIYDGEDLSRLLIINQGFSRGVIPDREITTFDNEDSIGSTFQSTRLKSRTIKMPFTIIDDTTEKRHKLAEILNVKEPKKLLFSDEPDRYFMAIPDQSVDYDDLMRYGKGTINWLCVDPFQYSLTEKTVVADDTNQINIHNDGNVPTPVSFEVMHSSDNGYIGIVSENATIEEGNLDEMDGTNYQLNDLMWLKTFNTTETTADFELNKFPSNYQPVSDRLSGHWNYAPGRNSDYRAYPTYAEGTNTQIWYGPSMYRAFTGTPNNWKIDLSLEVIAKKVQTLGVVEWGVVDAEGNLIAGYRIRKLNYKDRGLELHVLVGSDKNSNIMEKWDGNKTWIIKDYFGNMSIEKDGNYLRMRFNNETTSAPWGHSYLVPNQAQAAGFNFWAGSCSPNTRLDVSLFFVRCWDNSVGWKDSKNMFAANDKLTINCTDKLVQPYVNGLQALDIQNMSSKPILAPSGQSVIRFVNSNFAETPLVTAKYRERWL